MEDSCGHWFTIATSVNLDTITVPNTFEEAVQSRFAPRWHEAMVKEITDLLKNETWEPVDRSNVPAGKRITSSKWVYDLKYLRDGTIDRFKANVGEHGECLVAAYVDGLPANVSWVMETCSRDRSM